MELQNIIQMLQKLECQTDHIIGLFDDRNQIPQQRVNEAQALLKKLKDDLKSEYKRMDTVKGVAELSDIEVNFYRPAIQDAWANSGISQIRWNSRPDYKWYTALDDVKNYIIYWRSSLQSCHD